MKYKFDVYFFFLNVWNKTYDFKNQNQNQNNKIGHLVKWDEK